MHAMPPAYEGREQTWLKHRALFEYLLRWALKVGSAARRAQVKLWYVDVCAGPWNSHSDEHLDTSPYIAMTALRSAQEEWRRRGAPFELGTVFVEEDPEAFAELSRLGGAVGKGIDVKLFPGRFQEHLAKINRLIGSDSPAFVFVDPTGWKETPMRHVVELSRGWRDVLIRVPSETYRFLGREHASIQEQMSSFFGRDMPADLSEDETIACYCAELKRQCGYTYTLEMAVPEPSRERVSCWLVAGGRHPEVVRVFREVEQRVIGGEARAVRDSAKDRQRNPGQLALFAGTAIVNGFDQKYEDSRTRSERAAPDEILAAVRRTEGRGVAYRDLWPPILERHHLSETAFERIVRRMAATGVLTVDGLVGERRKVEAGHIVRLSSNGGPRRVRGRTTDRASA